MPFSYMLGDEQLLEDACEELRRFSRSTWTPRRKAAVKQKIYSIVFQFRMRAWLDVPPRRRTEERRGLKKMLTAVKHLRSLAKEEASTLRRLGLLSNLNGGDNSAAELSDTVSRWERGLTAVLASHEFQRKGRPESPITNPLALVVRTRDLMEQTARRPPGFGRETDTSIGPLVRTAKAIYRYASGNKEFPSINWYIAQAEKLSKSKSTLSDGLFPTVVSRTRRSLRIRIIHFTNPKNRFRAGCLPTVEANHRL